MVCVTQIEESTEFLPLNQHLVPLAVAPTVTACLLCQESVGVWESLRVSRPEGRARRTYSPVVSVERLLLSLSSFYFYLALF